MSLTCLSPNGVDIAYAADPPDRLVVGTKDGVVTLAAEAPTGAWRIASTGLAGLHISSLMREPTRGWLYAGVHGGGLYRSRDAAATWEPILRGLQHEHVFSLAYLERPGEVELFAGTEPAHLYRSTDYGEQWRELSALRSVASCANWNFPAPPHDPHVKHITFDPRDSDVMYVCIEQGALLKSDDAGASFYELEFQDAGYQLNHDTHRIVFSPNDPDEIYVDGGDGIARSRDGGRTWERLTTPAMRVGYPDHLYYPRGERDVLFVAGAAGPPSLWRQTGDAESAIARSGDGGRTWQQVGGGLPSALPGNIEAMTLAYWAQGYGFFAGTSDGEVFASVDRGATWSANRERARADCEMRSR